MSTRFLYWPVAGAIQFWREPSFSIYAAKAALPKLRRQWPEAEIERVLLLSGGSRRYYRWRNGRWSVHDHYEPAAPDDLARWGKQEAA